MLLHFDMIIFVVCITNTSGASASSAAPLPATGGSSCSSAADALSIFSE